MSETVIWLKDANQITEVGGKGLALGKLVQAGFNVPAAFIISAQKFNNMNSTLETDITENFKKLKAERVAVRSSGINEDGKNDAWAGQFDTFLNVSQPHLIEKIKECWQSGQSDRAKAYASQKGLESGAIAVIVQAMVDAEVSGVAFSVHPVTEDYNHIVIEATAGLGEQLVSGTITPDTYIVDKQTYETVEAHNKNAAVLNSQKLELIAETVKKIEQSFGFPVDVEWAWTDGQLYILQSRPITTLG